LQVGSDAQPSGPTTLGRDGSDEALRPGRKAGTHTAAEQLRELKHDFPSKPARST